MYPVENLDLSHALALNPSWHIIDNSPIKTLTLAMENPQPESLETVWHYPLYWHGYLVILKPALIFFPLSDLRILNLYLQLFLIATALILFYKKVGLLEMYAFLLAVAVINPVTTAMNFQNSDIFYIMLLSTIFILLKNEFLLRGNNYIYFFLIIGIVTAFLDFLTYPVTAFDISLCVCMLMNKKFFFSSNPVEVLKKLAAYAFAWGFGYGGMWIGKWIVATTKDLNVFRSAINRIAYRSSQEEGGLTFTTLDVFKQNFDTLLSEPFPIILSILTIFLLYMLIVNRQKFHVTKSMALTFLFIAVLPFIWYAALKNHSYVHNFFTYRNLSIALFGLTCFFIESLREEN